jgi:hypothetical protein
VYRLVHWEEYRHETLRLMPTSTAPTQAATPAAQQPQLAVASLEMLLSLVEEEAAQKATHEAATAAAAADLQATDIDATGGVESSQEQHELHTAAAKVQSAFRGYHVRRSLKVECMLNYFRCSTLWLTCTMGWSTGRT